MNKKVFLKLEEKRQTLPFVMALICTVIPLKADIFLNHASRYGELNSTNFLNDRFVIFGWGITYLVAIYFFIKNMKKSLAAIRHYPILMPFFLLIIISVSWSEYFSRSLVLAFSFLGMILIAAVSAPTFARLPELILKEVINVLAIVQFLNLSFILLFPDLSKDADRWKGFMGNPDALGEMCLCSFWANLVLLENAKKRNQKIFLTVMMVMSSFLIIKSQSGTSIVVALSLFFMKYLKRLKAKKIEKTFILLDFILVIFFIVFVLTTPQVITGLIGKNSNLTGRITIWNKGMEQIREAPLFGHGFGGAQIFYGKYDNQFVTDLQNSYLEILNRLGILGLLFFVFFLVKLLIKSYLEKRNNLFLLAFTMFSITCLTQSVAVASRNPMCLIFWTCAFAYGLKNEATVFNERSKMF